MSPVERQELNGRLDKIAQGMHPEPSPTTRAVLMLGRILLGIDATLEEIANQLKAANHR